MTEMDEELEVAEEAAGPIEEEQVEEAASKPAAEKVDIMSLTEDDIDNIADTAIEVLRDILSHFDASGAEINEYEGDDRELILDIVGGDLGVLIGRRGHTLDALQTLVSAIVRTKIGYRYPVTIDVESYKQRQREKLESMAYNAASRACRQGHEVNMRPMNPYERRIVHMALRDDDRVETYSVGEDPDRHVVVKPV